MQFLRSDWLLENLSEHDSTRLPAWVRDYHAALLYMRLYRLRVHGHAINDAVLHAVAGPALPATSCRLSPQHLR